MNDEYVPNEDLALAIVELLGLINKLTDERNKLTDERNRARDLVALLEAECSQCWGPMHTSAVDRLSEGEI